LQLMKFLRYKRAGKNHNKRIVSFICTGEATFYQKKI